jgi:hypothetical protein
MIPITVAAEVLEASLATITTSYQLFLTQVPKAYACAASYLRRPGSRPHLLSQVSNSQMLLFMYVTWDLDLVSGPRFLRPGK